MKVKAKLIYHLQQLGLDLLVGVAMYLAPLLAADDFSWSANWWLIVAGGVARRIGAILTRYVIRTWGARTPPE